MDEIKELKARAYDLNRQMQICAQELNNINTLIAQAEHTKAGETAEGSPG